MIERERIDKYMYKYDSLGISNCQEGKKLVMGRIWLVLLRDLGKVFGEVII